MADNSRYTFGRGRAVLLTRRNWITASIPGLLTYSVIWIFASTRLDFQDVAARTYGLWQSLGIRILEVDGAKSLLDLHIQPPGLTSLQLLDVYLSRDSHLVLGVTYFVFGAVCIPLIVRTLANCNVQWSWSLIAGLIYALIPATIIYTLWPFSTTPTALALMVAVWGVSETPRHLLVGSVALSLGVIGVFAFRPSFIWLPLLVGLAWFALWANKSRRQGARLYSLIIPVLGSAAIVGGIQLHYFVNFGLITTSSWAPENLAKALSQSGRLYVTENVVASFPPDSCQAGLAKTLMAGERPTWRPDEFQEIHGCRDISQLKQRNSEAWTSPDRNFGDGGNFNWSQRLANSAIWQEVMSEIIRQHPLQVPLMWLSGPRSGLAIYMAPAHRYEFVQGQNRAVVTSLPFEFLAVLLAPGVFLLLIVAWPFALGRKPSTPALPVLTAGTVICTYHMFASLMEYGENMRFQAELGPVLVAMGTLSLMIISSPPSTAVSQDQRRQHEPSSNSGHEGL